MCKDCQVHIAQKAAIARLSANVATVDDLAAMFPAGVAETGPVQIINVPGARTPIEFIQSGVPVRPALFGVPEVVPPGEKE